VPLDLVMLALPVAEGELEAMPLFDDPFLLAVPAGDPRPRSVSVNVDEIDHERLILLEEGHCLRDRRSPIAATAAWQRDGTGATSLTTVMQMVANGYGVTLVPQVAVDVEVRDERIKLLRLTPPQPGRTIGLVWRKPRRERLTSSRSASW